VSLAGKFPFRFESVVLFEFYLQNLHYSTILNITQVGEIFPLKIEIMSSCGLNELSE